MSVNIMTESYPVDLSVTEQPIKLTISNLMYQAGANNVTSVNGKKSDVVLTASDVGAATTAQGGKADSALQSADVAPVALSGSFSDLVNKSSLFNLVYSAYAVGSNAVIAATDTLGQMLGKLQGQISANTSAIDTKADATSTLQAINTKEPTIGTGTTSQYWRGDKTWRDFATDVRGVLLTGLSTATATAISATDSVLVALGKAQAQITNNSVALAPIPQKVGAKWYQSGLYYDTSYPYVPGSGTITVVAGQLFYQQFVVLEDVTFTQIGVNCTASAASSTVQLAMFDSDANNLPRNRLALTSAMDTSTAGAKFDSISVTQTKGQVVWLASLALGGSPTLSSNVYQRAVGGSTSATGIAATAFRKTAQSSIPSVASVSNSDLLGTVLPRISLLAQ